jgi:hypothetical protein
MKRIATLILATVFCSSYLTVCPRRLSMRQREAHARNREAEGKNQCASKTEDSRNPICGQLDGHRVRRNTRAVVASELLGHVQHPDFDRRKNC